MTSYVGAEEDMVGQSHGKSTGRRDDRMETVGHPADGNYVGDGSSDQNKSEKDTDSHNSASHSPKEHIGEISAHRPRHRRDGPLEPSEMTLSNESKSATQADSAEPAEGHSRSSIGHHAASGVKAAVASAAAEAGGKVAAWADDVPLPDIPLDVIPDGAIDTAVEIADDTKKELAGSLDAVQEAMGSAAAMVDGAGAAAFLSTIAGAAKGTLRVVANLPVFGPLAAPAWLVVAAAADIARASAANKRSCALLIRLMADVALSLTRMDPPALAALRQEVKSVVSALDIAKGVIESYRSKRWFRAVLTSKADEKRFLEAHQEVMYQWDRVTRSMTLASGSPRTPQSGSYGPDEALAKRVVALAGLPEGSDVGAAVETVAGDPRRHEALLQDMGVPQSTVEEEVRKGTEGLQEALAEIAAKIEEVGSKVDDVGTMVGTMHSDMSVEMQTLRNQLESMKSQQQEAAARQEALLLRAFESLQSAPLTAGMRGLDLSSAAPVALPPWTEEAVRRITGDFDEARLIARGGSAAIYWSDFNGQKLAVKRLLSAHGGLTNASELKKLVQNESSLLAKLQHQHIIRLFGTCVEPPCLIYGLCEGGTLAMHLGMDNASKRPPGPPVGSGTMPWQHRLRVMAEVSQALAYLHNCKPSSIYHRDLKPINILMSNPDPNDPGPAILADLGIAREVDEGKQLGAAQTTAVKGTGPYIDPIYSAIGRFGPWSDIYSFGIVLVQVLTGASPEDVVDKGSQGTLTSMPLDPSAGSWNTRLGKDLLAFGGKCCSLAFQERPPMSEVVRKLTEAAATAMGTVVSAEVAEMLREQQAAAKDREAREKEEVQRLWDMVGRKEKEGAKERLAKLHTEMTMSSTKGSTGRGVGKQASSGSRVMGLLSQQASADKRLEAAEKERAGRREDMKMLLAIVDMLLDIGEPEAVVKSAWPWAKAEVLRTLLRTVDDDTNKSLETETAESLERIKSRLVEVGKALMYSQEQERKSTALAAKRSSSVPGHGYGKPVAVQDALAASGQKSAAIDSENVEERRRQWTESWTSGIEDLFTVAKRMAALEIVGPKHSRALGNEARFGDVLPVLGRDGLLQLTNGIRLTYSIFVPRSESVFRLNEQGLISESNEWQRLGTIDPNKPISFIHGAFADSALRCAGRGRPCDSVVSTEWAPLPRRKIGSSFLCFGSAWDSPEASVAVSVHRCGHCGHPLAIYVSRSVDVSPKASCTKQPEGVPVSAIEFVRSNPPSPSPVAPKEAPKLLSIPQTDRQKVDLEAQLAAKRGQRESRWDEYTAAIEMGTTLLRAGEPEDFAKALGPIARASVLVWLLRGADDALNKETEEETARAIETMLSRLSEFRNGRAEAEVMFVRARRAALLDVLGETFPLHLGPPVHCGDLVPDLDEEGTLKVLQGGELEYAVYIPSKGTPFRWLSEDAPGREWTVAGIDGSKPISFSHGGGGDDSDGLGARFVCCGDVFDAPTADVAVYYHHCAHCKQLLTVFVSDREVRAQQDRGMCTSSPGSVPVVYLHALRERPPMPGK